MKKKKKKKKKKKAQKISIVFRQVILTLQEFLPS